MRIAILTRRFMRAGGGAEGYAIALAQAFAKTHEVHVFCQETDEPVPGLHYHRLWFWREKPRWLNQWVFAWTSWRATRAGFDVVHSHENTWHGQLQTIHVRPIRYNLLHGRTGWRRVLRWIKILTSPRLLSYVVLEGARFQPEARRHVVAASEALRLECEAAYPATRVTAIAPGVDSPAVTLPQAQARQALGLPTDATLLLFVANDYARKGLDALLQAMAQLSDGVHLAVVGSRRPQATYERQVQALGLQGRVHFLGPLPSVSPAYQAADALVHPTLEDSYGMVVLEAMAHGLPVVVSASPWCGMAAELRDEDDALLLTNPKDGSALATQIERLLGSAELQQSLREAGLRFASARGWPQAALKYEALF